MWERVGKQWAERGNIGFSAAAAPVKARVMSYGLAFGTQSPSPPSSLPFTSLCVYTCMHCMHAYMDNACMHTASLYSLPLACARARALSLPSSLSTYVRTYMHACMYVRACVHAYGLTLGMSPPPPSVFACMHACINACASKHTHTHTHTQHCREGARNSCARTGHICWGGRELDHCVHCRLSCSWPQSLGAETRRRGPWGRRRWWWRRW